MAPSGRPDSALRLPRWVALWHVLGGAAALYDASFLLLRPASLPGGPLHPCFAPYTAYAAVDRAYGPEGIRDGLVNAHSWINVAEAAVGFVAVFLSGNRWGPGPRVWRRLLATGLAVAVGPAGLGALSAGMVPCWPAAQAWAGLHPLHNNKHLHAVQDGAVRAGRGLQRLPLDRPCRNCRKSSSVRVAVCLDLFASANPLQSRVHCAQASVGRKAEGPVANASGPPPPRTLAVKEWLQVTSFKIWTTCRKRIERR